MNEAEKIFEIWKKSNVYSPLLIDYFYWHRLKQYQWKQWRAITENLGVGFLEFLQDKDEK